MADATKDKGLEAQVKLEEIKQYLTQVFHGYKQDPASSDHQRGHLAFAEEFADFFELR